MSAAPTVLILPGYGNSGPAHWQTLWERDHPAYRRVNQKSWDEPRRADWVGELARAVNAAPGRVTLAAHSLGCVAVAHWAAMSAHCDRVTGALLVAPPDIERKDAPRDVHDFRPIPMAPLPFPTIVVASTDDLYSDFARAEAWAKAWGSRLLSLGAAGHINRDAGYGPWPDGLALLAQLT